MSEASFASLGPTLLARKGGAKPAMRPQLTALPQSAEEIAALADEQLEDLGWNDMGSDDPEALDTSDKTDDDLIVSTQPEETDEAESIVDPLGSADIVSIHARTAPDAANEDNKDAGETLLRSKAKPKAKPKAKADSKKSKSSRRAAFTLRLDTERHLKLRLASTMQGVSAQALVTEALDALLEDIDDLDALVERMKRN